MESIKIMKKLKLLSYLFLSTGLAFGISSGAYAQSSVVSSAGVTHLKEYQIDSLKEAKAIQVITYTMPNVKGEAADATALVFYPQTKKPKDGWRIVVWTHGTVGVADKCAPSQQPLGENFKVAAQALLKDGYVVVAPDYEGLGTPGIHPYLNLKSEALSALYAIKAMKHQFPNDFQGNWMVAGQSQGGQAALGTAEFANEDASFKGAVAGAPASNLKKIIMEVAPAGLTALENKEKAAKNPVALEDRNSIHSYATLLAYGALTGVGIKAAHPDYDYLEMFHERSKPFAKLAEGSNGEDGLCLLDLRDQFKEDIIQYLTDKPDAKLFSYPGLTAKSFDTNTELHEFLADSQPGTKKIDKPILVIQGEADTNVPAVVTQEMVKHLKDLGSADVELILVKNASHTEAIVWKNKELVEFIRKHMPSK